MNFAGLIEDVAKTNEITKTLAEQILLNLIDTIKDRVSTGDEVKIVGFGTFKVLTRKPRKGRNPITGKAIQIPRMKVAKFQASAKFNERIRK